MNYLEKIGLKRLGFAYSEKIFKEACLGARLFFPVKSSADEFSVQAGIIPDAALITPKNQTLYNNVLFQSMSVKIDILKYFFIGGSMSVFEVPQTNTLSPWVFYSNLEFNAGLQFGDFKFIYEHDSQHPVNPYSTFPMFNQDGFYDKFYLEYKVKF